MMSATLPGKMSLKIPKPARSTVLRLELPGDRGSRLQNCQRRGGKQIAEMSLNRGVQRLIDIVRDRIEGTRKPRDFVMRIQGIRIERIANAESPGELGSHFPGVLRIEIQVEKVERLIGRQRESLGRSGGHSIDELRQASYSSPWARCLRRNHNH